MAFKSIVAFIGIMSLALAAAGDHSLRKRGLTILLKVLTDGCKGGACRNVDLKHKGKAFRPTSCLDYLRRGTSKSGIFKLYDHGGNSYSAYCDLKSEPGTAWTLVMSWSTLYRKVPAFFNTPFKFNAPVNENAQNWNAYRLSLARMKFLQSHSTHWRSTCSFPTNGVDFKDYMRGTFRDFNVVDFIGVNQCKKVEYINIRAHVGVNLTVRFWQGRYWFLHTDSSPTYNSCQFDAKKGSAHEEDNFGHYNHINPKFRCTAGTQSTTQWWFGARL